MLFMPPQDAVALAVPTNRVLPVPKAWQVPGKNMPTTLCSLMKRNGDVRVMARLLKKIINFISYTTLMTALVLCTLGARGFTADGWVKFVDAPQAPTKPIQTKTDLFNGSVLQNDWQWSVFTPAKTSVANGLLSLDAVPGGANYVAQKTLSPNYTATAEINSKKSTASAGISLVGDEKNQVTAYLRNNRIELVQTRQGDDPRDCRHMVANGKDISFFVGKNRKALTPLNAKPIDGTFLPPWDRALRVALIAKAGTAGTAMFDSFEMEELAK